MAHFAVSAIGRDRPGIVAAITEALLELGGNVEDSRMTILRGQFAVTPVGDAGERGPDPTHVITVYGADHPGIVHDGVLFLDRVASIVDDVFRRKSYG